MMAKREKKGRKKEKRRKEKFNDGTRLRCLLPRSSKASHRFIKERGEKGRKKK